MTFASSTSRPWWRARSRPCCWRTRAPRSSRSNRPAAISCGTSAASTTGCRLRSCRATGTSAGWPSTSRRPTESPSSRSWSPPPTSSSRTSAPARSNEWAWAKMSCAQSGLTSSLSRSADSARAAPMPISGSTTLSSRRCADWRTSRPITRPASPAWCARSCRTRRRRSPRPRPSRRRCSRGNAPARGSISAWPCSIR